MPSFSPLEMVYRGKYICHNLLSIAKFMPIEQALLGRRITCLVKKRVRVHVSSCNSVLHFEFHEPIYVGIIIFNEFGIRLQDGRLSWHESCVIFKVLNCVWTFSIA